MVFNSPFWKSPTKIFAEPDGGVAPIWVTGGSFLHFFVTNTRCHFAQAERYLFFAPADFGVLIFVIKISYLMNFSKIYIIIHVWLLQVFYMIYRLVLWAR